MERKANVRAVPDPSVGDWIREGLGDWDTYSVAAHVPAGFETYTLIRYPRPNATDEHPAEALLAALVETLEPHTGTPDDCTLAVWEGNGWAYEGSSAVLTAAPRWPRLRPARPARFRFRRGWSLHGGTPPAPIPSTRQSIPLEVFATPRFELPNRTYLLLRGHVREARNIGQYAGDRLFAQCPDYMWPADRAWIVTTDTDLCGAFVGGSPELQQALMACDALDTVTIAREALISDLDITWG